MHTITKALTVVIICLLTTLLMESAAHADKAAVRIEAPESAAPGSTITITLHISHAGNNFMHYTDWVYLKIDGTEVIRWSFSNFDRPESESFTRSYTHTINKSVELSAEADCNIHGSAGMNVKKVSVP